MDAEAMKNYLDPDGEDEKDFLLYNQDDDDEEATRVIHAFVIFRSMEGRRLYFTAHNYSFW